MDVCLEMVILHLFLFVAFMTSLGEGQNGCDDSRCGVHGPAVRFPFRLNSQPDYCGYPGLQLSCTGTNDTVLELPISVKLFVKDINYTSQVIQLYDPDRCLPKLLQGLNLSSTPFLYNTDEDFSDNYTVLRCPARETNDDRMIPCLDGLGYQFYAINSNYFVDKDILSCRKMYTLRSIPYGIVESVDFISSPDSSVLELKWSKPHCGLCESKGKQCKWKKNRTGSKTECFPADAKDASSKLVTIEQREDLRIFVDDDGEAKIAKKLAIVGLWCIQWYPMDRPSMKIVIQMLEGEGDKLTMPSNPFSSTSLSKVNVRALNHDL